MTRTTRSLSLGLLFLIASRPVTASSPPQPVALVYEIEGEVMKTAGRGGSPQTVKLFDRLPSRTALDAAPGSRFALAFITGRRYEIKGPAGVRLGTAALAARSGSVRSLPSVPPFPRLAAIAEDERPGPRAGAVRIRTERIAGLYPRRGAAALAGGTVLRFQSVAGAGGYRIEIRDHRGRLVFQTDAESPPVKVPSGTLQPGLDHQWTVRTVDRPGAIARGEADLVVLDEDAARRREKAREVLAAEGAGSLALLAEIDRSLGLWLEAREELRAALDGKPEDRALQEALAEITARLEDEDDSENAAPEPEQGAVVEEVAKGSAAEKVGARPGDLLLSWSQGTNSGSIRSAFDLHRLEIEQSPRGAVTLRGRRESGSLDWSLPPGAWGIKARPTLPEVLLKAYREGRDLLAAGDLDAGAGRWLAAVEAAHRQDPLRASWLEGRLARDLAYAGRWPEADAAWERAIQRLEASGTAAAHLLREWGETLQQRSLWERAEACQRRALALAPEETLESAWDLNALGATASGRWDLASAEGFHRKALAIRERLAPESAELAASLRNLAIVAARRGDLDTAEKGLLRALEIQGRAAPESLEFAAILSSLGNVALVRGDLSMAEEHYRRALAQIERLSPDGPDLARILSNLGLVAMQRGELRIAEERFRRTLAIREKLTPGNLDVASTLTYLGLLADKRGDFAAAEEHHRSALHIRERLAPGSPDLAETLTNLGTVARRRGDLTAAESYLQRALEIQERVLPESYQTALTYIHRALVAVEQGNLLLAEKLHGRALAMLEKQSPASLPVSDSLDDLGDIALKRGDPAKAEELFRRALEIREAKAPDSTRVGYSLNDLGRVYRQTGRLPMAAEHFCRAVEIFDRQRSKLGGTLEGRSAFGGEIADFYRDCVAALVDIGRPGEAFLALERGRARSFLGLLAQRELHLPADLPAELVEHRKQANADYDRTQAALSRLNPARDKAEIDRLRVHLRDLRAQQEEIAAKIRQASPRTAALQDPQPLDLAAARAALAAARAALDPGTVLLAWSVGKERTFLFLLQPAGAHGPGLEVFPLPLADAALRERVESFRSLLQNRGSDPKTIRSQARELYDTLLGPAEPRIAANARLLLSPDGPLHTLPFAALVRNDRYLAEEKPLHTVISATVYAQLKKARREPPPAHLALVAFGDPLYPPLTPDQSSTVHPDVRAAIGRGLTLAPLPSSREEVRDIAALYPQARAFLGAEATEERVKAIGKDANLLHFACHGLLDDRFPLNSALALSIPEKPGEDQDNGLLQAWEILENVHLNAELVTLSACDSALGQELGGEGLLGLTQAFQYAGARSVLASLWSVSDVSTARFMTAFYGYLRKGKSKDEALQAAQIDQIRERSESSHPFHWAAFELFGDWR